MSKLKKPIVFETPFAAYEANESIGEGGAGRVYGGFGPDAAPVAIKLLAEERASTDKRRRFKNEISFLGRVSHANIVKLIDVGLAATGAGAAPFYIMPRYDGNLRDLMRLGIPPDRVLPLISQILDGVEAAHLLGAVHRDLKPENILHGGKEPTLAVADFGVAAFTEDLIQTRVETKPGTRLANFQYAAPEQRGLDGVIGVPADIYALGLMINELFTGSVPHGTDYASIASAASEFGFLDNIVSEMIRQNPVARPASIAAVKELIQRYRAEGISLQRLSEISNTVVEAGEIDDPLALEPPNVVGVDWNAGRMTLTLNRPVTSAWIAGFYDIGSYTSVMGVNLRSFSFSGDKVTVNAYVDSKDAQRLVDYFKSWLPRASQTMKTQLEIRARNDAEERERSLRLMREAEEQRLTVLRNLKL